MLIRKFCIPTTMVQLYIVLAGYGFKTLLVRRNLIINISKTGDPGQHTQTAGATT